MERDKIIPIAIFVTILAVLPRMKCQLRPRPLPIPLPLPPPRPLCASQFSLVNYACGMLPYSPAPPVSPPPPPHHPHHPPPKHPHHPPPKHPHHGGDDDDDGNDDSDHHDGGGDDDDNNDGNYHDELEDRIGHSYRHGHGHRHRSTPEERNCCRWLKEVDPECVCDLLVRLPVFLARPVHAYSVIVDGACNVTYTCSGRLRP
ncbi:putative Tetratricopeptide repeat-like superfamily protein [Melia azedarach]|uniref:Tetratricopeptide repeat-like superfamily protein n=1 Tax=Melia azedarach TaxID=155640 RepID=A0ACC1YVK5_MELAZ|nr:putative Tetratricopeptide repeat-like superfamily protein [Melia azedarach]